MGGLVGLGEGGGGGGQDGGEGDQGAGEAQGCCSGHGFLLVFTSAPPHCPVGWRVLLIMAMAEGWGVPGRGGDSGIWIPMVNANPYGPVPGLAMQNAI